MISYVEALVASLEAPCLDTRNYVELTSSIPSLCSWFSAKSWCLNTRQYAFDPSTCTETTNPRGTSIPYLQGPIMFSNPAPPFLPSPPPPHAPLTSLNQITPVSHPPAYSSLPSPPSHYSSPPPHSHPTNSLPPSSSHPQSSSNASPSSASHSPCHETDDSNV